MIFSRLRYLASVSATLACAALRASAQLAEGYYLISPVGNFGEPLLAGSILESGVSTPVRGLPYTEYYDTLNIVWSVADADAGYYYMYLWRGASVIDGDTVRIDSNLTEVGQQWSLVANGHGSFAIQSPDGSAQWLYPTGGSFEEVVTGTTNPNAYTDRWRFIKATFT